jgi:hypothetical protein
MSKFKVQGQTVMLQRSLALEAIKAIFISSIDPQFRRFFTVGAIAQGLKLTAQSRKSLEAKSQNRANPARDKYPRAYLLSGNRHSLDTSKAAS